MSDPVDDPPPVDVQAEPSERAKADANRDAERANLEAAILRFNTNYNPAGGPPSGEICQGWDPLIIDVQETLPLYPFGLTEEVQPRDRPKEEVRLISLVCSNSCLDQEKILGI